MYVIYIYYIIIILNQIKYYDYDVDLSILKNKEK